jgi:hypothetical protein
MQRMKTAALPATRIEPSLRRALEAVLDEGETRSAFIEAAVRSRRRARRRPAERLARRRRGARRAQGLRLPPPRQAATSSEVKRYRVRVTGAAKADLQPLVRFLSEDDPATARRAAQAVAVAFHSLARLPFASRIAAGARGG